MRNNRSVRISRLSYLYFITMCLSLPLFSQITIKEKVVITPKENSRVVQTSLNTLRVVYTYSGALSGWSPSCNVAHLLITVPNCYGQYYVDSVTIQSSPTTLTENYVLANTYSISAAWIVYNQSDFKDTISVYLDTVLVNRWTNTCGYCNNYCQSCQCNVSGVAYFYTGFLFSSKLTTVTHGSSSGFNLNNNGTHVSYPCNLTTVWNNALPVTLNIIQGADLGSFYKGGVKVGSSVIGKKNSSNAVDSVSFVADGRQPCNSNGDTVVITATSNGITDTTKFVVAKSGTFTHFWVTITPDTISTCQPGTIAAIAQDVNNNEAFLACDTLVKLTTNGKFIRGTDTLSSPLTGVTYSDVKNGAIKVIPNGQSHLQTITVTVKKSSDTTKTGTATAVKGLVNAVLSVSPTYTTVIDGKTNIPYSLDVQTCVPGTSFSWAAFPWYTPAGNNPHLGFLPSPAQQNIMVDTANWYAYPANDECACLQSTYFLTAQAVIDNDVFKDTSTLTVYVPEKAAETPHPEPTVYYVPNNVDGMWKARVIVNQRQPFPTTYYLSQTSKFYNKMVAHENVHVAQWDNGIGRDLFQPESLEIKIKDIVAGSREELINLCIQARSEYDDKEDKKYGNIYREIEHEAYIVSDPISPRYFYQWNCVKDRIK